VVDPFQIQPRVPVFILPTSKFQFGLEKLKAYKDEKEPIKLPSPNHTWRFVVKSDSGKINDNGVFSSGLKEGETQIEVVDVRETTNTAETVINVVHPFKLLVNIQDITEHSKAIESTIGNKNLDHFLEILKVA